VKRPKLRVRWRSESAASTGRVTPLSDVRHRLPSQAPTYFTPEEISRRHVRRAVALVMILLMVQIWLLTSTLESFLVGQRETAVPAALISGLQFLACMEIYLLVDRLDREAHK
jgi:hypothetical protein